ncbi:MAG: Na+/H+ antiporter NhaC family protein [Woeseia sp.]
MRGILGFLPILVASIAQADTPEIDTPGVALVNVPTEIVVTGGMPNGNLVLNVGEAAYSAISDETGSASFSAVVVAEAGSVDVRFTSSDGVSVDKALRVLPGWVSIMPPLVAILIALTLRNVIPALLIGVWVGATALRSFSPSGILGGLLDGFQLFVTEALADADHAAIILFSLMIGGMVGIITRNGGMASIVRMIVTRAKTAIGGQIAVWLMGLMIFFDDYSNTLVVGNTARPLTDHLKISREKLAYIVDSTAAPVVCIALITTWIGYEVGLIGEALGGIPEITDPAYTVFLRSIPYSFYPILAVMFVLAVSWSGRDMGPMYKAEVRARNGQVSPISAEQMPSMQGEELAPKPDIPMRALNAFVPLLVLIVSLLIGLYVTGFGEGKTLSVIIGDADAYKAMMWASLLGAVTAAALTVGQGILDAHETVDAWYGGVRAMLFAMIVLVLAWALSAVTGHLHTADYMVSILADSLPAAIVPASVFVLSAITAFTTGTSWGTMGILMPLVVPLCWAVMTVNGINDAAHMHILYSAVACNLAGAVWGDHCSPISDTTVLSSMASGCDHVEHVRTQLPYAALVGTVAIGIGTIPGGYGFPPLLSLLIGAAILVAALRYFGKKVPGS